MKLDPSRLSIALRERARHLGARGDGRVGRRARGRRAPGEIRTFLRKRPLTRKKGGTRRHSTIAREMKWGASKCRCASFPWVHPLCFVGRRTSGSRREETISHVYRRPRSTFHSADSRYDRGDHDPRPSVAFLGSRCRSPYNLPSQQTAGAAAPLPCAAPRPAASPSESAFACLLKQLKVRSFRGSGLATGWVR
jgi:hypothetical protein